MGLTLIQNGTPGNADWVYSGSGYSAHGFNVVYSDIFVSSIPSSAICPNNLGLFQRIQRELEDVNTWAVPEARAEGYDDIYSRVVGYSSTYNCYKMCLLKEYNTTTGHTYWDILYQDGPNSYARSGLMGGFRVKSYAYPFGYITSNVSISDAYPWDDIGKEVDMLTFGLPTFTDLQDAVDYLLNETPTPSSDDPSSSIGGNSSIMSSTTFEDINDGLLSDLTILAEIDNQNLEYIAAALNTDIDISSDLGTNIAKVARALCQNNIKDGIMSLKVVPIPVNGVLPYANGNTETLFTPIGGHPVAGKKLNRYIKKYDIGVMRIEREFNDYRDYMCDYSIYLPFSGIHKLDASVIVGQTLILKCDIDFLCGTILYHIIVNDNQNTRDIYEFTGDCGIEIPITSVDYAQKYQAIVNGIFSGVGMIAGSALSGPIGGAAVAGVAMSGLQTAGNAMTTQGQYMQTGKLVPNSSALSCLQCYMIINKPISITPNIAPVKGRPCHKVKTLNNCSGFTIATNVKLDGIPYATDDDKAAIRSMLAQGVYL